MDVMQMVHQICRMTLLGGAPKSRPLGSRSSLPNTELAAVKFVESCMGTLKASRKMVTSRRRPSRWMRQIFESASQPS
jgi:hypothetical protein